MQCQVLYLTIEVEPKLKGHQMVKHVSGLKDLLCNSFGFFLATTSPTTSFNAAPVKKSISISNKKLRVPNEVATWWGVK